jgi:UDP-4-amino-4,6-dideoxy-N-acetyl-beta-L-altrosamine N-acetyltransferase
MNNMIDFVDINLQEKEMVLSWRNDESIKKWMYDGDDILLDNHLNFIDSLEGIKNKHYMVVKKDDNYLGVVDFTNIDFKHKVADFGLYSNPFEKVAGIGRILEEICIKYAFELLKLDTLKLEVFDENEKAKALYTKYNFQKTGMKVMNGKDVVCMELERKGKI